MTAEARKMAEELRRLPVDDLVDIHSELIRAIYEKEGAEGLDAERKQAIQKRIEEIDAGKVDPLDAFDELAKM